MPQRTCIKCTMLFVPAHGRQKYCSPACKGDTDHPRQDATCDGCGITFSKERRAQRWSANYCSYLCRDYIKHGPRSCPLPARHPARVSSTGDERPVETRPSFVSNVCTECGSGFITAWDGQSHRYCSTRCNRRVTKRRRRARELDAPGDFTLTEVIKQYIRQGNVCAYCEQPAAGMPEPEHVVPMYRGGHNDITNLVAACRACNADKCDMTLTEWAESRRKRALPPVRTCLTGEEFKHLVLREADKPAWRDSFAAA